MNQSDKIIENAAIYIRRLSPEGRAAAAKLRAERKARIIKTIKYGFLGSTLTGAGVTGVEFVHPSFTVSIAGVVCLGFVWISAWFSSKPSEPKMPASSLAPKIEAAQQWLKQQTDLPSSKLINDLIKVLDVIKQEAMPVSLDSPYANLVTNLLDQELKDLVDNYLKITPSLRHKAIDGSSPASQFNNSLEVLKGELDKLVLLLNSNETSTLAQQSAYLNLKYGKSE